MLHFVAVLASIRGVNPADECSCALPLSRAGYGAMISLVGGALWFGAACLLDDTIST